MEQKLRKTRPAVIVNDNRLGKLPLKIILPLTDWKERYVTAPWMVKITPDQSNNLTKESAVDCFQIRSIDEQRFVRRLGAISTTVLAKIEIVLGLVLKIT